MNKTMHLKKIGDFQLLKVLDVLDYARIFVCKNHKGNLLLFAEMETNDVFEKWVAVDISEKMLYSLLSNKMPIQKAFINIDTHKYYIITHDFNNDCYDYIVENRMPDDVLSDDEFFVGVDEEKENQKLAESAMVAFSKNQMPVLDLHFNPYTDNHSLPVGFLSAILENIKKIFNRITNSRKDYLVVEPMPGSFLIRFQSSKPESVIEKNTSGNAFKVISNVLTASSVEEISEDFVQNPDILASSKTLVSCIAKEQRNFDVVFADSSSDKPSVKNVEAERVITLDKQLKEYAVSVEDTNDYVGTLDGYDVVRKTFSFTLNDGKVYKGKLDKSFKTEQYKVPAEYKASIKTIRITDGENSKDKYTYLLMAIRDE